jgi:hypothetical protein
MPLFDWPCCIISDIRPEPVGRRNTAQSRPFGQNPGPVHPRSVRTVLRDHLGERLTIPDVAEILEVDEKEIMHLVDSGYFQLKMQNIQLFDD